MKTAFVHDWLVGIAGGEKVLEALLELYDGPIYTLLKHAPSLQGTPFASREVITSYLQRFPSVHSYYRNLLPLFPHAIESFDLSKYDLILSSSHAVAKGVKKDRPDQTHICYCHTPMRYAWDLQDFHLQHLSLPKRLVATPTLKALRRWDKNTQDRVDHYIANSKAVAARIKAHYGRDATVVYPPVDTKSFIPSSGRDDYFITCSRLVPYKRIDLIVKAFAKMPHLKLLVAGSGPEEKKLHALATPNVEFLGYVPDLELQKLIPKARAFIFAAEEDFGIVNVEAQAAGIPVIAYGKGGSLETVKAGQTGTFFKEQTPESLYQALSRFERMEDDFEPEVIRRHALTFSKERFLEEMTAVISSLCSEA